jgi:hypothetical protein
MIKISFNGWNIIVIIDSINVLIDIAVIDVDTIYNKVCYDNVVVVVVVVITFIAIGDDRDVYDDNIDWQKLLSAIVSRLLSKTLMTNTVQRWSFSRTVT